MFNTFNHLFSFAILHPKRYYAPRYEIKLPSPAPRTIFSSFIRPRPDSTQSLRHDRFEKH